MHRGPNNRVGDHAHAARPNGNMRIDIEKKREQWHQEHPAAQPEHAPKRRRKECRQPDAGDLPDIH